MTTIRFSRATGALVFAAVAIHFLVADDRTAAAADGAGQWRRVSSSADPTKALLDRFRKFPPPATSRIVPTGLSRADYLALIGGEIDFWKKHQNANGAIVDPYLKQEWQYSTPAFAHAAAALVAWSGRRDLIEPAAKALDWSVARLAKRRAATGHEDFYPPLIAHAMRLLKPRVPAARYARWEKEIAGFDPGRTYRKAPGSMNWNVVSACGETLFHQMGLRPDNRYAEASFLAQGVHFTSPHGLYVEGPMAYDLFPRLFLSDLLASGYDGAARAALQKILRRGAITSLFMQSPWGELPAGGRSAQHQWNEAEQCAVFEIYAAQALRDGDVRLAGIYKRAAHLALRSLRRWVRPSGEMQIVKNWVDPKKRHGYESYSALSQYNLLPMSMLALAAERSEPSEGVTEQPAPADRGGFVLELPEFHKIFANAGGAYVEIDTTADPHYDATGLIRIHFPGVPSQLGPSDSVLANPAYHVPAGHRVAANTGVGVAWKDRDGTWRRLGELGAGEITRTSVSRIRESPDSVRFSVVYEGRLFGAAKIVENYALAPGRLELTATVEGYDGPLRYFWPVLADDGRTKSRIVVRDRTVSVSSGGGTGQTFFAPGAAEMKVEKGMLPNHNGWVRLGVAEFPAGGKAALIVSPEPDRR